MRRAATGAVLVAALLLGGAAPARAQDPGTSTGEVRVDQPAPTITPGPAVTVDEGEPAEVTATVTPAGAAWTATVDGAPATVTNGLVRGAVATTVPGTRNVPVTACRPSRACLSTTVPLTVIDVPDPITWVVIAGDLGELTFGDDGTRVVLSGNGQRAALASPAPSIPGTLRLTIDAAAPPTLLSGATYGVILGDGRYTVELSRPIAILTAILPPNLTVRRWNLGVASVVSAQALPTGFPWLEPLHLTIAANGRNVAVTLDPEGPAATVHRAFTVPTPVFGRAGVFATGPATAKVTAFDPGA